MATKIEICNRALQKLGARTINALTEDSKNARSVNLAFESCKLAELADHDWNCAIKRAQLAEDTDAPLFGKEAAFTLPSDFVRLLDPDELDNTNQLDWQIENGKIYTDDSAPLEIRYIKNITNTSDFDPLLAEVLACRIALEICEDITQSNQKLQNISSLYQEALKKAKKSNAFQRRRMLPPEDDWVTVRN